MNGIILKKYRQLTIFVNIIILITAFIMSACSGEKESAQTEAQNKATQQEKATSTANLPRYLVAVEASYQPYCFLDENGSVVGFDIDILNAIAKVENFNLVFLNRDWNGIFETLDERTHDIVASGVVITEERAKQYDYTKPYLKKLRGALILSSNQSIKTFTDLHNKKVAAQESTTEYQSLKDAFYNGQDSDYLIPTKTMFLAIKSMLSGESDAAFSDIGYLSNYMTRNKEIALRIIPQPSIQEQYHGFVVRKGNTELLQKINHGLENIKENGVYQKIYEQWFGSSDVDLSVVAE